MVVVTDPDFRSGAKEIVKEALRKSPGLKITKGQKGSILKGKKR